MDKKLRSLPWGGGLLLRTTPSRYKRSLTELFDFRLLVVVPVLQTTHPHLSIRKGLVWCHKFSPLMNFSKRNNRGRWILLNVTGESFHAEFLLQICQANPKNTAVCSSSLPRRVSTCWCSCFTIQLYGNAGGVYFLISLRSFL